MKKGASGSLWSAIAAGGDFRKVAGDIAFPYGLHPDRRRTCSSARAGATGSSASTARPATARPCSTQLPGYPARLSPAADGGAWLALFAPRNRLIEFVLQEDALSPAT